MKPDRSFFTRIFSTRTSRRAALGGVTALALASRRRAAAQSDSSGIGEARPVGVADPGANAFEFVGVIQQAGMDFTLAGYVTNLAGVDSALLFEGADSLARSESTARL